MKMQPTENFIKDCGKSRRFCSCNETAFSCDETVISCSTLLYTWLSGLILLCDCEQDNTKHF